MRRSSDKGAHRRPSGSRARYQRWPTCLPWPRAVVRAAAPGPGHQGKHECAEHAQHAGQDQAHESSNWPAAFAWAEVNPGHETAVRTADERAPSARCASSENATGRADGSARPAPRSVRELIHPTVNVMMPLNKPASVDAGALIVRLPSMVTVPGPCVAVAIVCARTATETLRTAGPGGDRRCRGRVAGHRDRSREACTGGERQSGEADVLRIDLAAGVRAPVTERTRLSARRPRQGT